MVPLPTITPLPLETGRAKTSPTVANKPTVATRPPPTAPTAPATARDNPTVARPPTVVKLTLPRTTVTLPTSGAPRRLATITTSGPSRLTALTPTPDGASLTTPSLPNLTMTSNTPARSGLMMTSGPRITTSTPPAWLTLTARPLQLTPPREPRLPTTSSPSPSHTVATVATALPRRADTLLLPTETTATANGEHCVTRLCISSELAALTSLSHVSDIMFQKQLDHKNTIYPSLYHNHYYYANLKFQISFISIHSFIIK